MLLVGATGRCGVVKVGVAESSSRDLVDMGGRPSEIVKSAVYTVKSGSLHINRKV